MKLIVPEMNPKERMMAYMRGEEVDRLPVFNSASETSSPLYGISMRDFYFSADKMVEVESNLARDFAADNMGIGLGLRSLAEALGSKLVYPEYGISYVDEPVLKKLSDIENMSYANIEKDGRLPIIVEALGRLQELYGDVRIIGSGLAGPLTTATNIFGTEKFLKASVKDREGVHRLMQFCTDAVVECSKAIYEKVGVKFSLAEPVASGALISKKQFDELFFPYLKQTVERMNKFQGGTSIHICGKTNDRWQGVVDAGISSMWIDNCESITEIKKQYGNVLGITGNVDPVNTLRKGSPSDVDENVKQCILLGADNPKGFFISPGCTTPVGTPRENLLALVNATTVYSRGAKLGQIPKGIMELM